MRSLLFQTRITGRRERVYLGAFPAHFASLSQQRGRIPTARTCSSETRRPRRDRDEVVLYRGLQDEAPANVPCAELDEEFLFRRLVTDCRSRPRARARLDITVPIGTPATSAISL